MRGFVDSGLRSMCLPLVGLDLWLGMRLFELVLCDRKGFDQVLSSLGRWQGGYVGVCQGKRIGF